MKDIFVQARNSVISSAYRYLLKPILFLFDPEDIHDLFIRIGELLGSFWFLRFLTRLWFDYSSPRLRQEILGINFKNPIGLAAGFDKDARLTAIIPEVGFGFMEIGSVTGSPCVGNVRPRLWRLKDKQSLAVWYGLKNVGARVVSDRLSAKKFKIPVGTSVAMTNCTANLDLDKAIEDYVFAFATLAERGDYFTVNISCPNVGGGQPFGNPINLDRLLTRLDYVATTKPVFLKLSPNMTPDNLIQVVDVARRHRVQGLIASNLTKDYDPGAPGLPEGVRGGLSGKLSRPLAMEQIRLLRRLSGERFVIVGCGGVSSATDAYEMIRAGASLVQLVTGMIYEGPQVISAINQGLVECLQRDGLTNISQAVGLDNSDG